ncbi:MAG: hypothetical protein OYH76_13185 [Defluviicoccus sp.]|nr:hypothetical protein [Defluviicoccus sp.]MDE0276842.1 hypothetical protein [Defluviicoccus sp.]
MSQSHELPDDPVYAFCPAYDFEDQVQQIRIVFEDMPGYVPTAMVALTIEDAENICDKLNRRLGLDREQWSALVARSMADPDTPSAVH